MPARSDGVTLRVVVLGNLGSTVSANSIFRVLAGGSRQWALCAASTSPDSASATIQERAVTSFGSTGAPLDSVTCVPGRPRRVPPTLDMFAQTVTRDRSYLDPIHDALRSFIADGGHLLFGTDVGYLADHDTRGELAALAECGLGVADVLRMLTTHPSAALGHGGGTVTVGEPADLVVLERLETVTDLAGVRATIRDGRTIWEATR